VPIPLKSGTAMGSVTESARWVRRLLRAFGCDPKALLTCLAGMPRYLKDLADYRRRSEGTAFPLSLRELDPVFSDFRAPAGTAEGHYFHQDLWAARKVFGRRPRRHIDVGSRIDGFVAHLLVFMPVEVVDIRPLASGVVGLRFLQTDATDLLALADNSIESLTSLHAAEHFGLGRYGDAIDPDACFRFMAALERVLAPDGRLYFSVPIGRERLAFNALRVFGVDTIFQRFSCLQCVSLSYVDDDGALHEDVQREQIPSSEYACGLFEFTKLP